MTKRPIALAAAGLAAALLLTGCGDDAKTAATSKPTASAPTPTPTSSPDVAETDWDHIESQARFVGLTCRLVATNHVADTDIDLIETYFDYLQQIKDGTVALDPASGATSIEDTEVIKGNLTDLLGMSASVVDADDKAIPGGVDLPAEHQPKLNTICTTGDVHAS